MAIQSNGSRISNYEGRQTNSASIKNFSIGRHGNLWKPIQYLTTTGQPISAVTTSNQNIKNVYIQGDLFIDGSIIQPSDVYLKENVCAINKDSTDKIMNLKPSTFTFKTDETKSVHYGFIAQEFEKEYPELVEIKPDKSSSSIKSINYLEIIPLLVDKIQTMQKEIDILKALIK